MLIKKLALNLTYIFFGLITLASWCCAQPSRTFIINKDNSKQGKKENPIPQITTENDGIENLSERMDKLEQGQNSLKVGMLDNNNKSNEIIEILKNSMPTINGKVDNIDTKVNDIKTKIGEIKTKADDIKVKVDEINDEINDLSDKVADKIKSRDEDMKNNSKKIMKDIYLDIGNGFNKSRVGYDFTESIKDQAAKAELLELCCKIITTANKYFEKVSNPTQGEIDDFVAVENSGVLKLFYTGFEKYRVWQKAYVGANKMRTQDGVSKSMLNFLGENAKLFDKMKEEDVHKLLHAISISPDVEKDGSTWVYDIASKKCIP